MGTSRTMARSTFVVATVVATTVITLALWALTAAVHRWGASNVAAGACWAGLAAVAVWGLVSTSSDRRHGRGEWADIDERHELDNTLGGDS